MRNSYTRSNSYSRVLQALGADGTPPAILLRLVISLHDVGAELTLEESKALTKVRLENARRSIINEIDSLILIVDEVK